MIGPATLLVSRDPELIQSVRTMHDDCRAPRLVLCGRPDHGQSVLRRGDVFLVVAHLTSSRENPEFGRFLQEAADQSQVTVALVCDDDDGGRYGRSLSGKDSMAVLRLPRDFRKLTRLVSKAVGQASLARGHASYAASPAQLGVVEPEHLAQIRRVVDQDTTILLTGETGTGKTMLARHIHQTSARKSKPFMIVDCGALAAALIESEMFGHLRGAFTGADKDRVGKFAAAGDGTLVLDEINSLPIALQTKLLRAVEERVFEPLGSNQPQPLRARIIAISNVPLHQEVAKERFRADLYYRLNVVGFRLPPLRERWADVLPLAHKFLSEHAVAKARGVIGIAPEAVRVLEQYGWPGNVREVKNTIEWLAVACPGPLATLADLPECTRSPMMEPNAIAVRAAGPAAPVPIDHGPGHEERRICEALQKHRNNRARAAAELGMSRVTLYKRLHKFGLVIPRRPIN
jgi:DNA-binding NtrC family response regulator